MKTSLGDMSKEDVELTYASYQHKKGFEYNQQKDQELLDSLSNKSQELRKEIMKVYRRMEKRQEKEDEKKNEEGV